MFRESIQKMVDRLDGGVAGILMGFDGIAVESYAREASSPDIQTVGMELTHLIVQLRKAIENLEVGALQDIQIRADNLTILIRVLNQEYFLAFAVSAAASPGRARYLLRTTAPQISAEL